MRPNDILNLTLEPGQTLLLVPRLSHVKREVGEGIRLSLCELGCWGATEQLWNAFHKCSLATPLPNDKEIRHGVRWDKEIKDALSKMDVFIPLISVNFAVSHYIGTVECRIAKKRHDHEEIEVVLVGGPGKDECVWLMALQRVQVSCFRPTSTCCEWPSWMQAQNAIAAEAGSPWRPAECG